MISRRQAPKRNRKRSNMPTSLYSRCLFASIMAHTAGTASRLESYVYGVCSVPLRSSQNNAEENPVLAQFKEQEISDGAQAHSVAVRDGRPRTPQCIPVQVAYEQLPVYRKITRAETYENCGCVERPYQLQSLVQRTLGKPKYLLLVPQPYSLSHI